MTSRMVLRPYVKNNVTVSAICVSDPCLQNIKSSWFEGDVHPIPFDVFLHLNGKIVKAIFRLFLESSEQLLYALLIAQISKNDYKDFLANFF